MKALVPTAEKFTIQTAKTTSSPAIVGDAVQYAELKWRLTFLT
jgi:hypothetical protein